MGVETKVCKRCGRELPIDGFPRCGKGYYRRAVCKACYSDYHRAWHAARKAEGKAGKPEPKPAPKPAEPKPAKQRCLPRPPANPAAMDLPPGELYRRMKARRDAELALREIPYEW